MDINKATGNVGPLSLKEKLGYACGDVASNFYWRLFDIFLIIFYTDVFGIPAAVVGTMVLVARLVDAFSDPLMGALADRTRTRFGKFRPYLIWGILPIIAAGVLTFTVPDLPQDGKIIWAYATYILMMLSYTFINVPYGALLGVITDNSQQRTTLTAFRFIGAFGGGSLVAWLTPELVLVLGQGDEALGWQLALVTYGVLAAVLFIITFSTTRERIQPPETQHTPVIGDIRDLLHNKPWLVLFALALIIMLTISLRGSTGTFYFKYYAQRPELIGSFSMAYMLALATGAAFTPLITRWIDKKQLLFVLMILVTLLSGAFYFVPPDQIAWMYALQIAIGLCLGPKSPLVFSMYADTADYSEWKHGRRATAMVFAAASFSQKLGGALAGAMIGWMLASLGYVANQVQTASSQQGIVMLMTLLPALFALLSVFCIRLYPLDRHEIDRIQQDLQLRRREAP